MKLNPVDILHRIRAGKTMKRRALRRKLTLSPPPTPGASLDAEASVDSSSGGRSPGVDRVLRVATYSPLPPPPATAAHATALADEHEESAEEPEYSLGDDVEDSRIQLPRSTTLKADGLDAMPFAPEQELRRIDGRRARAIDDIELAIRPFGELYSDDPDPKRRAAIEGLKLAVDDYYRAQWEEEAVREMTSKNNGAPQEPAVEEELPPPSVHAPTSASAIVLHADAAPPERGVLIDYIDISDDEA
jgi:hypothetical protein